MTINFASLLQCSKDLEKFSSKFHGNVLVSSQYYTPLQTISDYFPGQRDQSEKVLDWGCGTGHISYILMNKGFDTHGYSYEPSDNLNLMKEFLKTKFNREWNVVRSVCDDPVGLPYPNEFFDAVFSVGVLEHVRETNGDELSSLKEIYRILKPNGVLFVFHFPNKYSWIEATIRTMKKLKISKKHNHQFLYRKKDIEELVKKTEFSMVDLGIYNLFPRMILRFFPKSILNKSFVFRFFNFIEKSASLVFKEFSQNYYFILRK